MISNEVRRSGSTGVMVGAYVVLAFLASGVLLVVQANSGIDRAALTLAQFGPAVAVGIVALVWRQRLAALLPVRVSWDVVRGHGVAVVVSCAAVGLLTAAMASDSMKLHGPVAVGGVPFAVFVLLQLVGAAGEEAGWRGFLQPVLESRYARPVAIGITGVVWAVWHVQAFAAGPAVAAAFLAAVLGFACVLGFLAVGSYPQRVLIGAVGHWLINVALYLVMGDDTLGLPQLYYYAAAALIVGAAVWISRRGSGVRAAG
ncbi:CPBP family intramembrane glutamic endopeptidase [Nocardia sp. NPDC004123]